MKLTLYSKLKHLRIRKDYFSHAFCIIKFTNTKCIDFFIISPQIISLATASLTTPLSSILSSIPEIRYIDNHNEVQYPSVLYLLIR
jgi:hypothetical protein